MDLIDQKILQLLQNDATLPVADIARKVGLSTTPCWRRIQKMEEGRVIQKRVAILDKKKVNMNVVVFVSIKTKQHNDKWLKQFSEIISGCDEVVEFFRMSGETDYLLKVVVPDIESYDTFYKKMVASIDVSDVSSAFAMESVKETTVLPLNYINLEKLIKSK